MTRLLLLAGLLLLPAARASTVALDSNTTWRVYWALSNCVVGVAGNYKAIHGDWQPSLPPPATWAQPEFDDQDWGFRRDVFPGVGHAFVFPDVRALSAIYLRGRFAVTEPRPLTLQITFRGGVVAYVNGQEVGRSHLPAGSPVAEDYPLEAFMTADGKAPLPPVKEDQATERHRLRVRTLNVTIPATVLRRGTNVLAIQVCRAAYREEALKFGWSSTVQRTLWATAGFTSATLSGDGLAAPSAAAVWNATPATMVGVDVEAGDALAPLQPIRLVAPRGGTASGQVVVRAGKGLRAELSLELPAIVRYARRQAGEQPLLYDALWPVPAEEAALQPVWVTVQVPATAKAGIYRGQLRLPAVTVPVEVTVPDFVLPPPTQWRAWTTLLESPETVAQQYNVPLWSEKHFQLLESSLSWQGQLASRMAEVSVLPRSWLGGEAMLTFRQTPAGIVPDFTNAERYLRLYGKHCGEPKVLLLGVWDVGVEGRRNQRPTTMTLTGADGPLTVPIFGEPGSEKIWGAVLTGAQQLVKRLGWAESCLMLGTQQDFLPTKPTTEFFLKVAPKIPWVVYSHSQGSGELLRGFVMNPQGSGKPNGWLSPRGYANTTNHRFYLIGTSALANYRASALLAFEDGFNGFGGFGLDYWTVTNASGRVQSALMTYESGGNWFRIIRQAVRAVLAPGPAGALGTVRYEMLREGLQEGEAFIVIEDALREKRLSGPLLARAQAIRGRLLGKTEALLLTGRANDFGWQADRQELFECAAAVSKEAK